jgi:threonine/homoserine/homoserine lactone efflux protein
MIPINEWLLFLGAALVLVLSPGPNMIYLISRSICQGRQAGVVYLLGVTSALFLHVSDRCVIRLTIQQTHKHSRQI